MTIVCSNIHGLSKPIKLQGVLTYVLSIDVTSCKVLNLCESHLASNFSSEYF
jgi:hypothetical protein